MKQPLYIYREELIFLTICAAEMMQPERYPGYQPSLDEAEQDKFTTQFDPLIFPRIKEGGIFLRNDANTSAIIAKVVQNKLDGLNSDAYLDYDEKLPIRESKRRTKLIYRRQLYENLLTRIKGQASDNPRP